MDGSGDDRPFHKRAAERIVERASFAHVELGGQVGGRDHRLRQVVFDRTNGGVNGDDLTVENQRTKL